MKTKAFFFASLLFFSFLFPFLWSGADGELLSQSIRHWATYYGGIGEERGFGVATDTSGNVIMTGRTASHDLSVFPPPTGAGNSSPFWANTVVNDASGGTIAWGTPANAEGAATGTYAVTGILNGGAVSNYLTATNFGITIPGGMIITGIEARVEWFGSAVACMDNKVYLVKGGVIQSGADNKSANTSIGITSNVRTYGSYATTWGVSLTQADVQSAGFGVAIAVTKAGGSPQNVSVDRINITVHYAASWSVFQSSLAGGNDAYIVKLNSGGNALWSTYYGGVGADEGKSVATDAAGNVYLAGFTASASGIASGGFQNTYGGGTDAFLAKFDPSGTRLWATYYGGSGDDRGWNVVTDATGNVYLAGFTGSASGISSAGFQNTIGGGTDAFLVKFDAAGSLLWATYYGETGSDFGYDVAVDPGGNVYLSGTTSSASGISSGGFQNTYGGSTDSYLVKFDAAGNRVWATYYGGTQVDQGLSVSTDVANNVYLAGWTASNTGIASGGFQTTYGGGPVDAYLVKFNSAGARLWATYYGGLVTEQGNCVATDTSGNVFLSGDTFSPSGIACNAFDDSFTGIENQFVVKFDSGGSRLCATYHGQVYDEEGRAALDASGNVYLAGHTQSTSGIASGGFQNTYGGGSFDSFLVKFGPCACVVSVSGNDTICRGDSTVLAVFSALCDPGYLWNTGATTASVLIYPSSTATYSVAVSSGTCLYDTAITVTVINPIAGIFGNTPICSGQSSTLTASGGTTYSWNTGTTAASVTVSPSSTTTYSVGIFKDGCSDDTSITITVNQKPTVIASSLPAGQAGNVTITHGQSATLSATCLPAGSGGTYSWSSGQTDSTIIVTPVTAIDSLPSSFGYCVTVSDANGCTDIACVTVTVESPCYKAGTLFLPNAFSPNADGENDLFNIYIGNIQCVKDLHIAIFDRWGKQVFTSSDPLFQWNGMYKDKFLAPAVFMYYMKATLITDEEITRKGNISLIK